MVDFIIYIILLYILNIELICIYNTYIYIYIYQCNIIEINLCANYTII